MNISAAGAPRLLALAALGLAATPLVACGSSGSSSPSHTVTVTVPPSSGGSAPVSTPASSPPAGPAECAAAALAVKVGSGNGAAGTIYYNLDFANVSGSTCFLQGYPGVSLVSAGSNAGSQIGADAKRDPVTPVRQIVLAPGHIAHAVLAVVEAGNFPASRCDPVTAHWLKVFPPDQTIALDTSFTTQTCSSTSVPTMRITTITPGA